MVIPGGAASSVGRRSTPDGRKFHRILSSPPTRWNCPATSATQDRCEAFIVRRVKRLNPADVPEDQGELFAVWRHHAFLTDDTLVIEQAEPRYRQHAIVEQVFSDLENGPLGHQPSGEFSANAAWLTLAAAAYNLMRAAGRLAGAFHAKATGATLRRTLINVPARIATSARRIRLHPPDGWPWADPFHRLLTRTGHRIAC
jgi:hypothetical protein